MHARRILPAALLLLLGAGCRAAPEPDGAPAAAVAVDSVLSPEEHLRRFREGLAPVAALGGGADSREALVERWVAALEANDADALVALHLTRAEFAYLYFPESPYAHPPVQTPPDFLWFQFRVNSEKGVNRAAARLGGAPLGYRALVCPEPPKPHGASVLHERCAVRRATPQGVVEQRLFGTVLEREGRFKFVSYANEL